jgi:hypothetical protein
VKQSINGRKEWVWISLLRTQPSVLSGLVSFSYLYRNHFTGWSSIATNPWISLFIDTTDLPPSPVSG